jgi:hypothetical protein
LFSNVFKEHHNYLNAQTILALAPSAHVAPSDKTMRVLKTTRVLHLLHPFAKVDFLPFIDDFHLEMEVTLDRMEFIFALAHPSCFSFSDLSSMVYKLL